MWTELWYQNVSNSKKNLQGTIESARILSKVSYNKPIFQRFQHYKQLSHRPAAGLGKPRLHITYFHDSGASQLKLSRVVMFFGGSRQTKLENTDSTDKWRNPHIFLLWQQCNAHKKNVEGRWWTPKCCQTKILDLQYTEFILVVYVPFQHPGAVFVLTKDDWTTQPAKRRFANLPGNKYSLEN